MARNMKPGGNGAGGDRDSGDGGRPGPQDNVQARKQIIAECAQQMRTIKARRKELNEDAAGVRERLKNVGIDKASFEAALRIVDMDDVAARNTYLDGLRESFSALGLGEQADLFSATPQAGGGSANVTAAANDGDDADVRHAASAPPRGRADPRGHRDGELTPG